MLKMDITVRCTLCLVWVAVFLSILSVRCTLTEKGFTFCKGETFKPPSGALHLAYITFCIFATNIAGVLHLFACLNLIAAEPRDICRKFVLG